MKRRHSATPVLLAVLGAACAAAPARPDKTIEPPAPEDSAFVLSREPAGAKPVNTGPVHIADGWWSFRATFLRISESRARARDDDLSEKQAPEAFWDQQTAAETIAIWTTFCNECHGGRRRPEDVAKMPPPAPTWGRTEGLFFGMRRTYADIFKTITNGKIEKEGNRWKMPAWRGKLSKEQIWALIYFVEFQSGGMEGRFPPSLYPRGEGSERQ